MRRIIGVFIAGVMAFLAVACGGSPKMTAEINALKAKKAKIAVVSMSVTDYGGQLQWTNSENVADVIQQKMNTMLEYAERAFAAEWEVVPAAGFVAKPEYRDLSIGGIFEGRTPLYEAPMPHFVNSRGDLVKTKLPPEVAQKLCAALGVEAVAVVYSEWLVVTGGMIPISKPHTKNVMSLWDAQGRELFHGRRDITGTKTLGAMGMVQVDENTVDVWVEAYQRGFDDILGQMAI
jgi:hypothetical protein